MRAEPRHNKFAGRFRIQMPRSAFACQRLFVDHFLQGNERIDEGLGTRRASGNMNINGNVAVDPFKTLYPCLKGPPRWRTRPWR